MSIVELKSPAAPAAEPASPTTPAKAPPPPVLAPAKKDEYNRLKLDFREPMPRPKVRGIVIDWHTHLLAARHAKAWFEAAAHYGIDAFGTMTPLEEALVVQREWPGRV